MLNQPGCGLQLSLNYDIMTRRKQMGTENNCGSGDYGTRGGYGPGGGLEKSV
jgi:hypothetical protein